MRYARSFALAAAFALLLTAPGRGTPLPPSPRAPAVGARAPEFTLPDTNGQPVTLSKLLAPEGSPKGSWVLLVFYRGYW